VRLAAPGVVNLRVRNAGRQTHALRVEGPPPDIMVETNDLKHGDSEALSAHLSRPGKYPWYCPYHRGRGMTGTIIVGRPGGRRGGR
jgi:plastocyanin